MTKQNNAKLDQNELSFEQDRNEVSIQVTLEYRTIFSLSSSGQRNGITPPPPSPR